MIHKFIKLCLRGLLRLCYGVKVTGLEHYHEAGDKVLIIANHTSLLDGILLYAWLPETPTFAINTHIANRRAFRPFLRFVNLFIMDPTNPLSIKSMIRFINARNRAVIFPEGRITTTGALMKIYEGPGLIADKSGASILPVAIEGPQYSPFSYMRGRGRIVLFPRITLTVLPPRIIEIARDIHGYARRRSAALQMQDIMYLLIYSACNHRSNIFSAFLEARRKFGKNTVIVEDINREPHTYQQVLLKALVLAELIREDTAEGENIGVMLPNVVAMPVMFLALNYLRRVPAMLNFSSGLQNILRACETGQIRTVYTSRKFIANAGLAQVAEALETRLNLIYLEDLKARLGPGRKLSGFIRSKMPDRHFRKIARHIDPDDPAVILFTSGSEGVPKGVVLTHSNILSNYAQVKCHIDFRISDTLFSCLPTFHSFGLNAGMIMPLLAGSKIFFYPTPLHYRIIPEYFYELGATILFGSNTFFKGYARYAHPFDFSSARYVVAGAEKLHQDTMSIWMEKFGIRIYQGYGVTETSPVISVNTPMQNKLGTVGRAMPAMQCRIDPVEGIDTGGRLVVKGPNVMPGYLLHGGNGRISFPETPHGKGWYDTGDIASIDDEGFITILGRAKRFDKIGGEMISLTAIEDIAMQIWPQHNHAAVSVPDERKGEKIILVTDFEETSRKAFQEHVKKHKYSEMTIPRQVLFTHEFPGLGTGKIDYPTLTELAHAADQSGESWLSRLTSFVRKHDSSGKAATTAADSTSASNSAGASEKTDDMTGKR